MQKSKIKYDESLDSKRKAALKLIQKAETTTKSIQDKNQLVKEDQISKLVNKMKAAEERRMNLLQNKLYDIVKQKQINIERRDKASHKVKELEINDQKKAIAIEKRMEVVEKIIEQKHLN